jgi:hypothetical protein
LSVDQNRIEAIEDRKMVPFVLNKMIGGRVWKGIIC